VACCDTPMVGWSGTRKEVRSGDAGVKAGSSLAARLSFGPLALRQKGGIWKRVLGAGGCFMNGRFSVVFNCAQFCAHSPHRSVVRSYQCRRSPQQLGIAVGRLSTPPANSSVSVEPDRIADTANNGSCRRIAYECLPEGVLAEAGPGFSIVTGRFCSVPCSPSRLMVRPPGGISETGHMR
jgi:hypothetical protein